MQLPGAISSAPGLSFDKLRKPNFCVQEIGSGFLQTLTVALASCVAFVVGIND
jgi:hypothetical protein